MGGRLLNERGKALLSTEDGGAVGSLPLSAGRAVASSRVVVPSPPGTTVNPGMEVPPPQAGELRAFKLPSLESAWSYRVPGGGVFVSKELRLAQWEPGGQRGEVVVAGFAVEGGVAPRPVLVGVSLEEGSEAFRCPVSFTPRSVPQLWELGPGSLVLMDGASTCGECDPPFANSRGRFLRLRVPGLSPAREPWPGTFGGPGYGHHEGSGREP